MNNLKPNQTFPKIALSLMIENRAALAAALLPLHQVKGAFDVIEWRVDFMRDLTDEADLIAMVQQIKREFPDKIMLLTCRTKAEGGNAQIQDEDYWRLNQHLARSGAIDWIDVEFQILQRASFDFIQALQQHQIATIVSYHDFAKTSSVAEWIALAEKMSKTNASMIKIAMMAHSAEETVRLMYAAQQVQQLQKVKKGTLIAISMGEWGKLSRLSGQWIESPLTFACLEKASAPGQIDVIALKNMLDQLRIKSD